MLLSTYLQESIIFIVNQIIFLFTFRQSPTIALPKMVNKRISDLPFDESAFNNAKVIYELALKHSGCKSKMEFDHKPSTRRNRNRKIIWFNPPLTQH